MPDFFSLTKITAGAYLGMTPKGTQYILLSYEEDGSAKSGNRTLKGTFWAVIEITDEFDGLLEDFHSGSHWFEVINPEIYPTGTRLAADTFRTRYAARNWADLELDHASET